MTLRRMKHNPAFLSREELVASFVVRRADLDLVIEHIREQPDGPPQHALLIGPRGIGKTTMVLRIAAAVESDPDLGRQWYPLVFGEEAYQVATAAELWLEAILRLADQTGEARLRATHRALKNERDERRLYERALGVLMDFADAQKKRLLVIVENMNMILGEQLSADDGWTLRHTLQNERRILLLGTATTRFDAIDDVEQAMYDLFWVHDLRPLDTEECRVLWTSISGDEIDAHRIRPVQILTGGSPRLLSILASFASGVSFRDLMLRLTDLVDDHTNYFKSNLESLPVAERKVYAALADIWAPATAREVAEEARISVNTASALLHRLQQRGAVVEVSRRGRKVSYQVAERMYNIYHLMRRGGGEDSRVRAVVDFMVHMYGEGGLVDATRKIVAEAVQIGAGAREDHFRLVSSILSRVESAEVKADILTEIDPRFFALEDAPEFLRRVFRGGQPELMPASEPIGRPLEPEHNARAVDFLRGVRAGSVSQERLVALAQASLEKNPNDRHAWMLLALGLEPGRRQEAIVAIRRAVHLAPAREPAAFDAICGALFERWGDDRAAIDAYKKFLLRHPKDGNVALRLGALCTKLGRLRSAARYYRKSIGLVPSDVEGWNGRGRVLLAIQERDKAERVLRQAIGLGIGDAGSWGLLGSALVAQSKYEEAEHALRRSLDAAVDGFDVARSSLGLAFFLAMRKRSDEALATLPRGLQHEELVRLCRSELVFLIGILVSDGRISECLAILRQAPARAHLEPVIVALQLFLGEEHNAPQEILEVAKDLVRQIEAGMAASAAKPPPPAG